MDEANPTTVYGVNNSVIQLQASPTGANGLFNPNFGPTTFPSNSIIVSALLWIYVYENTLSSTGNIPCYLTTRDWVESECTWNEWKSGSSWASGGALGGADVIAGTAGFSFGAGATGWFSADVKNDIQNWIDGTPVNLYGWSFPGIFISGHVYCYGNSYTVNPLLRPYLTVTWTH